MSLRDLNVQERKVQVYEAGKGAPVLYLHGIADMHGLSEEKNEFVKALEDNYRTVSYTHLTLPTICSV